LGNEKVNSEREREKAKSMNLFTLSRKSTVANRMKKNEPEGKFANEVRFVD
jgi:hypothetical protein